MVRGGSIWRNIGVKKIMATNEHSKDLKVMEIGWRAPASIFGVHVRIEESDKSTDVGRLVPSITVQEEDVRPANTG